MRDYWKYVSDIAYPNGGYQLLLSFPWKNTEGHDALTVRQLWELFQANGHDFSGIIGSNKAASQIQPGYFVGSLSNIDPQESYWVKMLNPFSIEELNNNNTLNFTLSNLALDGKAGYVMDQPDLYTQDYIGLQTISYGEDTSGTLKDLFKYGKDSDDGSSPEFHAGNSPVDDIIGSGVAATRVFTSGAWKWVGSLDLRPGMGMWMRFNRMMSSEEGTNLWEREAQNSEITGAFAGTPDYDGGASRTIGMTYNSGSNSGPYAPSINAWSGWNYTGPNQVTLLINPPSEIIDSFNIPQPIGGGSMDGTHNSILDPMGNDITNDCWGTGHVMTAAKRHQHSIATVGPDSTTTNGLPVGSVGVDYTAWQSSQTHASVMGGYENISHPGYGVGLNYKIVTNGSGVPTMTINTGDADGGCNFQIGDQIEVTDPGNTDNTATFVVSGVKHNPNYQFWPTMGTGACNVDIHGNMDRSNYSWIYQNERKVMWKIEINAVSDLTDESTHPGLITGYTNMDLYADGASDESGLQFRFWHESHQKFYMLRLYTNGGVPISDANMTVKNFFNDYCYKPSIPFYDGVNYILNQGYYFKMENFTDNPSAGWNE
jgi:hypothetical protein